MLIQGLQTFERETQCGYCEEFRDWDGDFFLCHLKQLAMLMLIRRCKSLAKCLPSMSKATVAWGVWRLGMKSKKENIFKCWTKEWF